ncbi:MAG: MFS transporter, partial [Desulfobacterales bacterium]
NQPFPPLRISWIMWGLGAIFYLVGFFQRVAPGVMTEELMRDFGISAAALGNLSGFYFYSYVAMQIPTGILADTWGPRRLLSAGAVIAGAGTVLFALAPGLFWASAGRLLIGGSVAVAFVGLLKLAANWFPTRYFAAVTGAALFVGIIGAVSAGPPLRMLMNVYSWRSIMLVVAALTLATGAMIWIFVRDDPIERGYARFIAPENDSGTAPAARLILQNLREVFSYGNTGLLFFIPAGIVGATLAFAGLWGVPYLSTHYGMSASRASVLTSALLVAWAAGGPAFGWMSDLVGKRKPLYILGCTLCLAGWSVIFYLPGLHFYALFAVLAATGFFSGCMVVSFAFAKESVPLRLAGTVSGVVNMGVMSGPMILQPAVGAVLDRYWQGGMENGIRLYSLEAYQKGFALMTAWLMLSLILLFFTRETSCRQHS